MGNLYKKLTLTPLVSGAMLLLLTFPQVSLASHGDRIVAGASLGELTVVFTNRFYGGHHSGQRSGYYRHHRPDRHGRPYLSHPVFKYPHHSRHYRDREYRRHSYLRHTWGRGHHHRPYDRYRLGHDCR